jgi:hypothetical protein
MPTLAALAAYRFDGRNEQAIREGWIAPLLDYLGYRIDTLNEIEYEQSVALRHPVRLLGHTRLRVDYKPTVLRRELWLIEAKAPKYGEDWEEHLGQAWSYATHPEINVPIMAIADGSRLAVYDVTIPEWDTPVLDVPTQQIASRFNEVANVLGARQVAGFVRRRQLQRLSVALRAEIDADVLDETVNETRAIVDAARPFVQQNRQLIVQDQAQINLRTWQEIETTTGLYGLAQHHNGPLALSPNDVDQAVRVLLATPPDTRPREFGLLLTAAQVPPGGPARLWWPLRALRLAIALRVRHESGCEAVAGEAIREAVRDHLRGFPTDPLARAAHRLERSLPVLLARLIAQSAIDLPAVEAAARATLDPELWLRMPITASSIALVNVNAGSRKLWFTSEWTEEALNTQAADIEQLLKAIPDSPRRAQVLGPRFDETTVRWDDLTGFTIIFVDQYGSPTDIPHDAWPTIGAQVDAPGNVGISARRLLESRPNT